jgi:hypothetical protein
VEWLRVLQVLWPIAVCLIPLVLGAGFLWLKTQFPTKADLKQAEEKAAAAVAGSIQTSSAALQQMEGEVRGLEKDITARFERGSRKFADHDKRLAVVEKECEDAPTKNDLAQMISVLGGRMSGVESAVKGVEKQLGTQHDYLRTLIDRGSGQ